MSETFAPRSPEMTATDPIEGRVGGRRPFPAWKKALLLSVVLLGLLVLRTRYSLFVVQGESMLPGLRSGDLILINKQAYRVAPPERGDVVVARLPHDLIVKRIVGLPGEEVELRRGDLYVNRLPLVEDYALERGWLSLRKGKIFDDRFALLGDNRSLPNSLKVHAVVPRESILGKVIWALRPPVAFWRAGVQSGISTFDSPEGDVKDARRT